MKRYTKPTAPLGWLYVVSHPNAPNQVKIGITERPVSRMQELGNPKILARVPVMKPRDKEQLLHNRFAPQRVPQTEYFQLDQEQLDSVLSSCTSWMKEVADFIVEPQIPEGITPEPHFVKAEPLPQYLTPEMAEERQAFMEPLTAIKQLLASEPVPIGEADPPTKSGVYLMTYKGEHCYAGLARGRLGLRDRILRSHLHGDKNHVLHRELSTAFPDKTQRVAHIKEAVSVQWVEVEESKVFSVENALINRINPTWNRRQ